GRAFSEPVLTSAAASLVRRDEHIRHVDREVLERRLARLADHERGLREVLAVAGGEEDLGAGEIHVLGEGEVLHVHLAAASAAAHVEAACVARSPAPGEYVDLAFVG